MKVDLEQVKVTIIVPVYNLQDYVESCVQGLYACNLPLNMGVDKNIVSRVSGIITMQRSYCSGKRIMENYF